jgi:dihydrolipoamide dehydrogenase
MGMKVTLVDADPNPGGVRTFRGCIPSKALLHAATVIEEAKHAEVFGISFGTLSIDIAKLRGWKDAVVKKQTGGLGLLAKSRKVAFIHGRASIVDARTLSMERVKTNDKL